MFRFRRSPVRVLRPAPAESVAGICRGGGESFLAESRYNLARRGAYATRRISLNIYPYSRFVYESVVGYIMGNMFFS